LTAKIIAARIVVDRKARVLVLKKWEVDDGQKRSRSKLHHARRTGEGVVVFGTAGESVNQTGHIVREL